MYNRLTGENNSQEKWKIVDQYDSTYWSGQDVAVYANKILLDEVIQISYVISEQVRPIYGYADYVPHKLYHGARIVQGEFTINYKKSSYGYSLLEKLRDWDHFSLSDPNETPNSSRQSNSGLRPPVMPWAGTNPIPNFDDFWQQIKENLIDPVVAYEMADKYRDDRPETADPKLISPSLPLFESNPQGFDLNIIMGGDLAGAHALRFLDQNKIELVPMDTGATINAGVLMEAPRSKVSSTGRQLRGVSITAQSQTIADDGRGILETYNFMARDVRVLDVANNYNSSPEDQIQSPIKMPNETSSRSGTTDISSYSSKVVNEAWRQND